MNDLLAGMPQEKIEELLAKAAKATSAEDLVKIAAENGLGLGDDQAAELYERLCLDVELSQDEMDACSGGWEPYH